jgi:DNA polymerase I
LKDKVAVAAKRGYIIGFDGRQIPVRHEHAALNTLLQGAGAIIAKYWYLGVAEELLKQNIDGYIALMIHDELQVVVREGQEESVIPIFQKVLTEVENLFKIRIKLDCETKTGKTWYDTH